MSSMKYHSVKVFILMLAIAFLVSCGRETSAEDKNGFLSNEFISLEFYTPHEGGGLRSLKNNSGFEFINRRRDKSLWQIEMKQIPQDRPYKDSISLFDLDSEVNDGVARRSDSWTKSDMILIKSDAVKAACKAEKSKDELTMSWQGIDVGAEKAVLDVSITVTLSEGDRFARFRASFNNRSEKFTVFYFTAPIFNGIYPPDGKCGLDFLASPVYNGRLMHNPIENGILGEPYRFQPNRSGHSMQFDAYYHGDNGLYFGCFDGMQNVKRYYLATSFLNGLSWAMVHVPDNMKKVPQTWNTPYDTVLRCYQGDWFDACQIYREWALKQSWTSEGPLIQRTSTPKWFKEINMWMRWGNIMSPPTAPYNQNIQTALGNLSRGLHLHYWGKGHFIARGSPDRFPLDQSDLDTIKLAKEHNYPIMGFIQTLCWDNESDSFKKANGAEHTVRNFYGQRVVWKIGKPENKRIYALANIAYPGKVWTDVLGDTIVKMAQIAGFKAAYMDSFNHGGTYMNFNPLYSKQTGGGNTYIKDNQKMLNEIKDRVRKVDPDFCFSGESFWEGNIGVLDAFLTCNTTYQPLKKGEIFAIPMIHAVYHDYTICLGAWISRWDLEEPDSISYIAKIAQTFTWGVKEGWVQPVLLTDHKDCKVALEAAQRGGRAYDASLKFLVYGQMLREPKLASAVPELDIKWYIRFTKDYFNISMPAVLRSMWRAPDGNLGLVLYNISPQEQKITLVLDDPGYGIEKAAAIRIASLYPVQGQATDWQPPDKQTITLNCTVPARSPMVFEIELKH